MTYFHPSNKELNQTYGYASQRWDLDATQKEWTDKSGLDWSRPVEADITSISGVVETVESHIGCMSAKEAAFFTKGARAGFKFIGKRHNMTPVHTWEKLENGMKRLGIHLDDLESLQSFVFGWEELGPDQLQRWALRYPRRCPLLDTMCSLDSGCKELNETQDWILKLKGSSDRRRLDVLPALPEPDGVRPAPEQIQEIKGNSWGVSTTITGYTSGVF
jgi:hypothetical protein